MFKITLSDAERSIVDELHTDYTQIPFYKEIIEVLDISSGIDWFWSYSDDGNTLRHGEERVSNGMARMLEIAEATGLESLIEVAKTHLAAKGCDAFKARVRQLFPWVEAYRYASRATPSLAVELEITGKLDVFNDYLETLARQTWMVAKDMPAIYNQTILSNRQVSEIAKTAGVPVVSLQTYVYNHRGVTVPARYETFASSAADMAEHLVNILADINFRGTRNINIITAAKDAEVKLNLGLREYNINNRFKFVALLVRYEALNFYIPICTLPQ